MSRRLHYYAQPFWDRRREPAQRYEFVCAVDAEERGEILARSADGVLVYQQWADPELELFGEVEVLAQHGSVPLAATGIDPDGRDPWLDDIAYFKIDCSSAGDMWTQIDPLTEHAGEADAAAAYPIRHMRAYR